MILEDELEFEDGSVLVIKKIDDQLVFVRAEKGIAEAMAPVLVLSNEEPEESPRVEG